MEFGRNRCYYLGRFSEPDRSSAGNIDAEASEHSARRASAAHRWCRTGGGACASFLKERGRVGCFSGATCDYLVRSRGAEIASGELRVDVQLLNRHAQTDGLGHVVGGSSGQNGNRACYGRGTSSPS